ncbi:MAG: hypothetical protein GQE15_10365 [Archangiaceae bacterium]|nr:hypothetical protein [Archangiaceae bacterium]
MRSLLLLVGLSLLGCQTKAVVVRTQECSRSCPGCCDATGTCLTGEDDDACGAPRSSCRSCGAGSTCRAGSCEESVPDAGVTPVDAGVVDAGVVTIDAGVTPCPPDGWCLDGLTSSLQPLVTTNLRSVWATSPADVWVVGDGATVLHFDGLAWSAVNAGLSDDLFAVWASGPNDVWISGGSGDPSQNIGVIARFDGTGWRVVSRNLRRIDAIWGSRTDDDVWFGGPQGTLLKWNGSALTPVASNTTKDLVDFAGSGSRVWAVGSSGLILENVSGTWSEVRTSMTNGLTSAIAFGNTLTWAAGGNGALATWDGATWRTPGIGQDVTVMGLWGARPDAVWSVGPEGEIHLLSGVTQVSKKVSPTTRFLRDVHGSDERHVWAVGFGGVILRYRP